MGGAVGECELATTAFGHRFRFFRFFPASDRSDRSDRSDGFTREEGEWEWVGGTFLEWIVALFVFLFVWRRQGEACFGEEGECEDGQAGRGKEDVQCRVVDPLDPCVVLAEANRDDWCWQKPIEMIGVS